MSTRVSGGRRQIPDTRFARCVPDVCPRPETRHPVGDRLSTTAPSRSVGDPRVRRHPVPGEGLSPWVLVGEWTGAPEVVPSETAVVASLPPPRCHTRGLRSFGLGFPVAHSSLLPLPTLPRPSPPARLVSPGTTPRPVRPRPRLFGGGVGCLDDGGGRISRPRDVRGHHGLGAPDPGDGEEGCLGHSAGPVLRRTDQGGVPWGRGSREDPPRSCTTYKGSPVGKSVASLAPTSPPHRSRQDVGGR